MHELTHGNTGGLVRMQSSGRVKVIAIASGKGGVGKTNASVNLAISLSRLGRRVMILDADLGLANVDVMLGLQPAFDISHVLSGQRTLEEIAVEGPQGIRVVPSASGILDMVRLASSEHHSLIGRFGELGRDLDIMIVDTAAGISDSVTDLASACGEIVIVASNEPAAITDAYALIKVLRREHGISRFQILSSRTVSSQDGLALYNKLAIACERFLDVTLSYLGCIPDDDLVRRAILNQQAVVEAYPGSSAACAFRRIAKIVDRWPSDTSGPKGFFNQATPFQFQEENRH